MPFIAIEIISPTQHIQDVLEKASVLVNSGVKAVWTIEPFTRIVFVTTEKGVAIFHENIVETEGIKIDFAKVFSKGE